MTNQPPRNTKELESQSWETPDTKDTPNVVLQVKPISGITDLEIQLKSRTNGIQPRSPAEKSNQRPVEQIKVEDKPAKKSNQFNHNKSNQRSAEQIKAEDEPSEKSNQSERDKLIQPAPEITKPLHRVEGEEKAGPPGQKCRITEPTSTRSSPTVAKKNEDDTNINLGK